MHEDAGGYIAAQAHFAEHHCLLVGLDIFQKFAKFIHRIIFCPFDGASFEFLNLAHIDEVDVLLFVQNLVQFSCLDRIHQMGEDVLGHHAGEHHRAFGGAVGWCVGVFAVHQVENGALVLEEQRDHVDLFIHILRAHRLCA